MSTQLVLVVPALLLIALLVVQFALVWHARHIAQYAAERALAAARVEHGTAADGQAQARRSLAALGSRVLTSPSVAVERTATQTTVRVSGSHPRGPWSDAARLGHGLGSHREDHDTDRRPAVIRKSDLGQDDGERGSAAVELVLVTPLLLLVLLVVVAFGRLADARLIVADAAHQAARAASLARTDKDARALAEGAASAALREAGASCTRPSIRLSTGGLTPGATVTAQVSCTTELGDLTRTGLPGHVRLADSAFSVVDTFRSTP
ncbi:TadE/TadG family type IV pilus assembly protein [Streptomyces sp. NPDC002573]|uniref:TadE/TadG family type IV pilus assembly protein n=1 Tax=Streptomyces sp. NPDC002573 TaxID=3364651 RepID=UPI00369010BA